MIEKSGVEKSKVENSGVEMSGVEKFMLWKFMVEKSRVEKFLLLLGQKSSWLKYSCLKRQGLKLGVEKSRVEMSFNCLNCMYQTKLDKIFHCFKAHTLFFWQTHVARFHSASKTFPTYVKKTNVWPKCLISKFLKHVHKIHPNCQTNLDKIFHCL